MTFRPSDDSVVKPCRSQSEKRHCGAEKLPVAPTIVQPRRGQSEAIQTAVTVRPSIVAVQPWRLQSPSLHCAAGGLKNGERPPGNVPAAVGGRSKAASRPALVVAEAEQPKQPSNGTRQLSQITPIHMGRSLAPGATFGTPVRLSVRRVALRMALSSIEMPPRVVVRSASALDQVITKISLNDIADVADLQRECRLFESRHHLAPTKVAQISTRAPRRTI